MIVMIENIKPCVVMMSEARLTEDIEDSEVNIKGYKMIRCNSYSRYTGGVVILVKNGVKFTVLKNEVINDSIWWASIRVRNRAIAGTYTVFYRSPNNITDCEFLKYFERWCSNECDLDQRNIICGDFNINLMVNDVDSKKMTSIINNTGMKQLVRNATRITKNSKSLVDYVISDNYNLNVKVLIDEKISEECGTLQIEPNN